MWGRRRRTDEDFAREVESHLQLEIDRLIDDGLSREEARAEAHRRFGNVTSHRERFYESGRVQWLDHLWRDIRYAVRSLRRSPAFAMAAIATLTIGIGATIAVFSVINAVLLKPLQAPRADRLVRFQSVTGTYTGTLVGAQRFDFWRSHSDVFDLVSAHRLEFVNVTGGSEPEFVPVARVTTDFLPLFGATLSHGRSFTSAEDRSGGPRVAVLSYAFWTRRFGRDRQILGQTIALGGVRHAILGVLGPGFDTEQFEARPDVWVPFQYDVSRIDGGDLCTVTGRLRPGVTLEVATARLTAADATFQEYRADLTSQSVRSDDPSRSAVRLLSDVMVGDVRPSLRILAGAVGFVLLIACANVANLLLARGLGRRREIAIRAALGAGRRRIMRQLLTESVLLATAGAGCGLLLGTTAIRALLRLVPGQNPMMLGVTTAGVPRIGEGASSVVVDGHVLLFTLVVTVGTTILFGFLPASYSAQPDLTSALKQTTSGAVRGTQRRARGLLVATEIALAVMLLVGAALLIRTFQSYLAVDTGFDATNVITMRTAIGGTSFDTRAGLDALTREGTERIRALPGMVSASTACCMPLETVWQLPFVQQSRPSDGLTRAGNLSFHGFGGWTFVSPGYFDTLGIPILRGRDFTDADASGAPGVVIINETMAHGYWPDSDPLGDRLTVGLGMSPEYDADPVRQIVGIVQDVRTQALARPPRPEMYVPLAQVPDGVTKRNVRLLPIVWIAKTHGPTYAMSASMATALEQVSGLAVARVRSMRDVVAESTGRTRFNMWLMTAFGLSALMLAAIGVYGLTAYTVHARTAEIGIRLALGATPLGIRTLMVRQIVWLSLLGIAVGSAAAWGLKRVISSLLFGVTAGDPVVFGSVPLLLAGLVMLAAYLPARRASRVDPVTALRAE